MFCSYRCVGVGVGGSVVSIGNYKSDPFGAQGTCKPNGDPGLLFFIMFCSYRCVGVGVGGSVVSIGNYMSDPLGAQGICKGICKPNGDPGSLFFFTFLLTAASASAAASSA